MVESKDKLAAVNGFGLVGRSRKEKKTNRIVIGMLLVMAAALAVYVLREYNQLLRI
ncbi:MAG TPA: hypothetical protein VK445_07695 [Dissulfurispiraceae bacterium]|nr:hypothetical protein [Dissulfurispiraceae bacterium]